ncbi:MAG: ferritin-like domain-containing protein [Prosthecobacter sp.]|nr:ferritin-like domain-containing protein [Prosthecobacter sp.]
MNTPDTSRNLAWKLNWYRQSELEGSLLLGRMVGAVEDGFLCAELTRHAAEEAEHSRLWDEVLRALALPHIRIFRSYQSFYLRHTGPPATLLEVLCFTQIFERRVHRRFSAELMDPATPTPARQAYQRMLDDEKGHLSWVASWLKHQPEAADCLRRYQHTDLQVYHELLSYENRLHDIPGLGREHQAEQPHPPHLQPARQILA